MNSSTFHRLLRTEYYVSLVQTEIYCCKYYQETKHAMLGPSVLVAYFYIYVCIFQFLFHLVPGWITFLVILVWYCSFSLFCVAHSRCDWDKRLIFAVLSIEGVCNAERENCWVFWIFFVIRFCDPL